MPANTTVEGEIVGQVECRDGRLTPIVVKNPYEGEEGGPQVKQGIEDHEQHGHIDKGHMQACTAADEGQPARWSDDIKSRNKAEVDAYQVGINSLNNSIPSCNGSSTCEANIQRFINDQVRIQGKYEEEYLKEIGYIK